MSIIHRRIQIALSFIKEYPGDIPFSIYIKKIFKQNKNWGSKDRKFYREISYLYWKTAHQIDDLNDSNTIDFLINKLEDPEELKTSPYEKFNLELSAGIDNTILKEWFLPQAPTFLYHLNSIGEIKNGERTDIDNCIAFKADTNLETYIESGAGIIQDWSSTASIKFLLEKMQPNSIWETCAGAGGKSILLSYLLNNKKHIASDIRKSIINNLKNRFALLDIPHPETQIIDLSKADSISKIPATEIVIADMPCSGSGTWRRTPERLSFSNKSEILNYSVRQLRYLQNIANNHSHSFIYYMTCSIFRAENEDVVDKFLNTNSNYSVEWQNHFHTSHFGGSDFIYGCLIKRVD